jgi:glycosyltransferase involved in cell wall biosynthesis
MVIEAIQSVLAQREVRFELIVVDDGSTDGTPDAVEGALENAATPVRLIQTERRGVAAARNLGVEAAAAPLIGFLDSDDLWKPQKLARQLAHLRDHREYRIAQCNELWIRNGRRVNPGRRHLKHGGDIFVESLRTCLISPSAVIMGTDLLQDLGGFDETMTAAEDYDLWLRILLRYEVGLLEEALAVRRAGHADQLSATVPAIDRFRILALAKLLAAPELTGVKRTATAEVLAEKSRLYARGLKRRQRDASWYDEIARRALEVWARDLDPTIALTVAEIQRRNRQEAASPNNLQ